MTPIQLPLYLGLILTQVFFTTQAFALQLESLAEAQKTLPISRHMPLTSWRTTQGSKVIFMPAPQLPMLDIRVVFAAGSRHDGKQLGIATITNAMLNEGTGKMDATEIANGFESLGASFSNGAYRDMAIVSIRSLSDPDIRKPALELFTAVMAKPSFPKAAFTRVKNQMLAGLALEKQSPEKMANTAFMKQLYGKFPYAHNPEGTEESLAPLTPADALAFFQRHYHAQNATIAMVGNIDQMEAKSIAEQISNALHQRPISTEPSTKSTFEPVAPKAIQVEITHDANQTHLILGQLGITRHDPDWPALYLGSQILGGGGFGSRLMEELREKRGLTYGVYSAFSPMAFKGPFTIKVQTRADQSQGTLDLIRSLFKNYLEMGPTEEELHNAKLESTGSLPLETASNSDIVNQLGMIGFYDLPLDYLNEFSIKVQKVTQEDVKNAMQKHLSPDQWVVIKVGPDVKQNSLPPPSTIKVPAVTSPMH